MADNEFFDYMSAEIEKETGLARLAARGSLRLVLKDAGLDVDTVTPEQLSIVMEKLMPEKLRRQGIKEEAKVSSKLAEAARSFSPKDPTPESAASVFKRLTFS